MDAEKQFTQSASQLLNLSANFDILYAKSQVYMAISKLDQQAQSQFWTKMANSLEKDIDVIKYYYTNVYSKRLNPNTSINKSALSYQSHQLINQSQQSHHQSLTISASIPKFVPSSAQQSIIPKFQPDNLTLPHDSAQTIQQIFNDNDPIQLTQKDQPIQNPVRRQIQKDSLSIEEKSNSSLQLFTFKNGIKEALKQFVTISDTATENEIKQKVEEIKGPQFWSTVNRMTGMSIGQISSLYNKFGSEQMTKSDKEVVWLYSNRNKGNDIMKIVDELASVFRGRNFNIDDIKQAVEESLK
ncbi:Hypothetical_protein [Hexamita inflata]|uniref:Hypothetical_protein n=1 Tax=Hexamita inflata TaxID=28002 RepID=A0ABP1GFQ3_9EUKA